MKRKASGKNNHWPFFIYQQTAEGGALLPLHWPSNATIHSGDMSQTHCVPIEVMPKYKPAVMLVLVLVLKDSLRTIMKSLSLSWSLIVKSWSLSWSLCSKSLSWSFNYESLSWSFSKSPWMGPCFGGPRSGKAHLLWTSKAQGQMRRRHSRKTFNILSLVYFGTQHCQKWTVVKQRLITPAVKLPTVAVAVCTPIDSRVSDSFSDSGK